MRTTLTLAEYGIRHYLRSDRYIPYPEILFHPCIRLIHFTDFIMEEN